MLLGFVDLLGNLTLLDPFLIVEDVLAVDIPRDFFEVFKLLEDGLQLFIDFWVLYLMAGRVGIDNPEHLTAFDRV